jgi:hypothetical protein
VQSANGVTQLGEVFHQENETFGRSRLEAQSGVLVAAFRASAEFRAGERGVNRIAADAVKDRLPPLAFKAAVIAPVVIEPQAEENCGDNDAVDHDGGGQFKHRRTMGHQTAHAKRSDRSDSSP